MNSFQLIQSQFKKCKIMQKSAFIKFVYAYLAEYKYQALGSNDCCV